MKPKIIKAHMKTAENYASLSTAVRLQVGSIIVKDDRIISIGYNGMPSGWDNMCEDKVYDPGAGGWLDPDEFAAKYPFEEWHEGAQRNIRYGLKTKPEVLHADRRAPDPRAQHPALALGRSLRREDHERRNPWDLRL